MTRARRCTKAATVKSFPRGAPTCEEVSVSAPKAEKRGGYNRGTVFWCPYAIHVSEFLAARAAEAQTPVVAQAGHRLCRSDRRRRSEEHTSELQSRGHIVCRLLLEKKK